MKKIFISIFLFFLLSSVALAAYKREISSRFIQFSNFVEIQENVFVSPNTTQAQKSELLDMLDEAKNRITEIFGEYTASPIIISSYDPTIRSTYSNNSYAKAYLPPFSKNKAYIVLGEKGHNTDIVAHELMHAEVFQRIGYLNHAVKIPVWFNEGVSMQVDYRIRYDNAELEIPVNKLKYGWQFFRGNDDELTQHYSIAKAEVKAWLNVTGNLNLYRFLGQIKSGRGFNKLYLEFNNES